ncbi:MAG TPA: serine/threonine-protein kinase, partial [Fimbriiglobus sp.]
MTDTYCSKKDCPTEGELKSLLASGDSSTGGEAVTGHVGECPQCQDRIEALATGGDVQLSKCCRGMDKIDPPSGSAYWEALNGAELALTMTLNSDDTDVKPSRAEEIKLDFLRPPKAPGRLGMLGHFEVIRVIGRGGMGVVLHAFDDDLQREVAVKLLDPQLAGNETARTRFCREARSAAAVTHENIVAVHQVDEDDVSGLPYLVMQLVTGESLEARLARGPLSMAESVRIGAQAAAGLAAAHAAGLIHRDIKPGNILIEAGTDKARLTDFGLARATEDLKLTRTGFVAGTPLYMAPEQARGDEVDHRADLFALGSVLYETVAGKPPFDGKTPLQVLRRIADDRHEPLHKVNPEVPDWFADLIDGLLAKDVNKRIQTAAEVSETLAEHLPCVEADKSADCGPPDCGPSKALSMVIGRKVRSRTAIGVILGSSVAAGLAIGGVGGWFLGPRPERIVEKDKLVTAAGLAAVGNPGSVARNPGPKPLFSLPGRSGGVLAFDVSPDGTQIVTGVEDGIASLWDLKEQRITSTLVGHRGPIWSVNFTNDGKNVLSASDDSEVFVWDLTKNNEKKTYPLGGAPIRAAAIYPKSNMLVTGDRAGKVGLWDMNEKKEPFLCTHGASITAVAISADGKDIASAGVDGKVLLWDAITRNDKPRITLDQGGHQGPVYGLAYSPNGKWIATSGWDKRVLVWEVGNGIRVKEITGFADGVSSVAFTPCCRFLATGGRDGTVIVYDLGKADADPAKEIARFSRHRGAVTAIRFMDNGGTILASGRDGVVYGWKLDRPADA